MDFFTSDQTKECSVSSIPNLGKKSIPEIKQQSIQKEMFQPLEPIYEEEEDSTSNTTLERSSCTSSNGITKSSWGGSEDKLSSITTKTEEKLYEWTKFIKPENLGKTVVTDLKRRYAPFKHKKVKSALKDECDKDIVSKEWPLILDLQNNKSYFPYSDKCVAQDLQLDSASEFPEYEEKKPKEKRMKASAMEESEESGGEEDIRTTLYLPSVTPPSSASIQRKTTPLRGMLDVHSILAVKRKDFMQLMNDSEKAEFQRIIEELDTKEQDDPHVKKEKRVQEELYYLSAKAPPPPRVLSRESIPGEYFSEQEDYEETKILSESSRKDEYMEDGEGTIPSFPGIFGEAEISQRMRGEEGSVPAFIDVFGESITSEGIERGESSVLTFPGVVGENETSEIMERGEGSIPAFPEVVGENETPEIVERGEGSIPAFPEVAGENEASGSMKGEENAISKSSESMGETEYSETDEECVSLQPEDKAVMSIQGDVTSYMKYKQAAAGIEEGEDKFIQTKEHFQLLETESAVHEDSASDMVHSLLHDVVKTAETEAQKLIGLSETRASKPIQVNTWEEDYNICFKEYLKTLPEPIRNHMEAMPRQLKEQIYEYSSESTSQLLDLPGTFDTIKSDNLLIDQSQAVSLTKQMYSAEVLQTVTDCEDEVWIPKLNAYYAYTEDVKPEHRLGHFMHTALELLQQKYEVEGHSFEMEDLEVDKEIRVLPNQYCLEFGTEDPYDEHMSEVKFLQLKPLRCIIFGKPGLESKQLAMKMADYWRCIYINVCEELKKELASETNVAQMLKGILEAGDVAPGALVFRIILQRILQPRVKNRGYILDGFPYHSKQSDLSPLEQLQGLFLWEFRPNIIIYLACPDADVIKKREQQYYDIVTDNYYSSKEKFSEPNHLSWAKHFVRRELDFKENILKELEYYKMELLPSIEYFTLQYDPQFVIRVDGRRDSSQIFQVVAQRLVTLSVQKSVDPQPFFPLPPEEPAKISIIQLRGEQFAEGKQMEVKPGEVLEKEGQEEEEDDDEDEEFQKEAAAEEGEEGEGKFEDPFIRLSPADVIEALSNRDIVSPQFTWQLSGWQFNCPVLLFEGITKMGDTRFSVRYMDKIYFLSSVDALKKFCENPQKYLMPPYPKPGCKYIIVGPPYFGRSLLALYIAEVFGAKIILFEELKEKNTCKKREEHIDACRKQALEKAIASTEEILNQEWLENEKQRKQQVKRWMDDACTLLEKYLEYIQQPPVEIFQSSGGESSLEIPGVNAAEPQHNPLSDIALLLEQMGIPIGLDNIHVEDLLQNSEQLMEFLPSYLQPLSKPGTPDITHPRVCKAVDKAVFEAQKDNIELTQEELITLLDKEISDAEQELIRRTNGQVTTGGWVVDGIPLDLQLWKKLVECDILPDHVLCLMDDEPDVQYWQNQLAIPLFNFSLELLCKAAKLRNQKYKYKPEYFSSVYSVAPTTDDMVFPAEKNLPSDDDEDQDDEASSLHESSEMGPPNTEDSVVSISSSNEESTTSKESDDSKAIRDQDKLSLQSGKAHSASPLQAGDSAISTPSINHESSDVSKTTSKGSGDAKSICDQQEMPLQSDNLFDALFKKTIPLHYESLLQTEEDLPPEGAFDASPMKTISPEAFKVCGEDVVSDTSFMRSVLSSILPSSKRLSDQKAITAWIHEAWKKAIYAYSYSDFCIDYPSDKEEEAESLCDESDILLADKIQVLQKRQLHLELQPLLGEYKGESTIEEFVREIDQFNEDWLKLKESLAHKLAPLEINIHNKNINDIISDTVATIEDEYRVHPEPYHSEALPFGEEMGEFEEEVKQDIFLGDTGDYCPVALHNNFVLWHGKKNLAAKYKNKVYYFSTEEAMIEFMKKPYKFTPMSRPACGLPPVRICCIGPIGSGKTLLGKMFSLRLGLKLVSLNEEINKFVTRMGWMPMGRDSQNFFISVSKTELGGEEGENMEEHDESSAGWDENTSGQNDDMGEYMGEYGGLDEALIFEQKMLQDIKRYYTGGLLPEWLVQNLVVPLWLSKEGFILEGFPTGPKDVQLMKKYCLIPDIIINLQVLEKTVPSRVLASFLDIWRGQQDEEKRKVEEKENEKRMEYEKNKARRRKQLIWKIKLKYDMEMLQEDPGEQPQKLQDFRAASEYSETQKLQQDDESVSENYSFTETEDEGYWDLQDMPDLEDWLNNHKNSPKLKEELQKILDAEFPPLVLAHAWEDEEHAALRLKHIIKTWYNQDSKKIAQLRVPIKEMNILWEDVNTEIPLKMLMEDAAKRAIELNRSDMMLEQTYDVSLDVAMSLIECGYYFLSRFGYWCPVQVAEKTNPIQMYFPAKESGNIFPIIHRKYIYFLAGQESAQKFKKDPLKYLQGEFCSPVVPIRLAIVGPPKSGKSTMAQRLARKFGIKAISMGGAIRQVLQDMADTEIANNILRVLQNGEVVPDDLAIMAVEAAVLENRSSGQGFVYDGFPDKVPQMHELAKYSLLPYAVIVLKSKKDHCLSNLHRSDLATFRVPLRYSDLYFEEMFNTWEKRSSPSFEWMSHEYQNLIFVDAEVSEWKLGHNIEQIVLSVMQNVQDYFINMNKGLPAQVQYMCVNKSEWEQRKTREILHYCPVCLKEKSLVTSGPIPDRIGLLQYLCHLYWVCSDHKDHFMKNPKCYIPSPDCRLPDELPQRVEEHKIEIGELFADGLCVVCYNEKSFHGQLNKGLTVNCVQYNKMIYLFCSEECLSNFMKCPHKYKEVNIHYTNFDLPFIDNLQEIPVQGFLEQAVYETIIKCLSFVGTLRPKILCTKVEISAAVYLGLLLKVNNKNANIEVRKKFQVALKQFLKRNRKVEKVTKMFTSVTNPHFDWMKEFAETAYLPKKVHKKPEAKKSQVREEPEQERPTSSFVPCGYIYPIGGEDTSSICTIEALQSVNSDLSSYRGTAPTSKSGSGTSVNAAWRY